MEKLKYSDYGWLPEKSMKPYNNHTVVIMVQVDGQFPLLEKLGYYENGSWFIYDVNESNENKVHYWYPIPSFD